MKLISLFLAVGVIVTLTACNDTINNTPDSVTVKITQPANNQTINDSLVRIMTDVTTSCGCQTRVEFYINHVQVYADYVPYYSFDWNIKNVKGEQLISTRAVVEGKAEAWDSVRVNINP